jgi:uncharacterized protein YecE (DUF72 family)
MKKLFIGTSGWIYGHWGGIFYPESLPSKDKLKYFSQHFKTAEINYSFYHLPRPGTYQSWYNQVPADFVFSVKASRFITHIKRLQGVKEAWKQFFENALNLKEKLGPILFQFPPSFSASAENIKRLEDFLKIITTLQGKALYKFAFEFRHKNWCDEKVYNLFKKYNVAWVIADSPSYPKAEVVTTDFVYIRMHGSKVLFSSKYTNKELKTLAQKIKKWFKLADVYVYFNNDTQGYAIENARELLRLCRK